MPRPPGPAARSGSAAYQPYGLKLPATALPEPRDRARGVAARGGDQGRVVLDVVVVVDALGLLDQGVRLCPRPTPRGEDGPEAEGPRVARLLLERARDVDLGVAFLALSEMRVRRA